LLLYKKKERADSAIVAYPAFVAVVTSAEYAGYDGRERYRDPVSGILNLASRI
jgi:hypothetical protein